MLYQIITVVEDDIIWLIEGYQCCILNVEHAILYLNLIYNIKTLLITIILILDKTYSFISLNSLEKIIFQTINDARKFYYHFYQFFNLFSLLNVKL